MKEGLNELHNMHYSLSSIILKYNKQVVNSYRVTNTMKNLVVVGKTKFSPRLTKIIASFSTTPTAIQSKQANNDIIIENDSFDSSRLSNSPSKKSLADFRDI